MQWMCEACGGETDPAIIHILGAKQHAVMSECCFANVVTNKEGVPAVPEDVFPPEK